MQTVLISRRNARTGQARSADPRKEDALKATRFAAAKAVGARIVQDIVNRNSKYAMCLNNKFISGELLAGLGLVGASRWKAS